MFLNVPMSTISAFQADHPGNVKVVLMSVIDYWLNNDPSFSWDVLASALEECGHAASANKIRTI